MCAWIVSSNWRQPIGAWHALKSAVNVEMSQFLVSPAGCRFVPSQVSFTNVSMFKEWDSVVAFRQSRSTDWRIQQLFGDDLYPRDRLAWNELEIHYCSKEIHSPSVSDDILAFARFDSLLARRFGCWERGVHFIRD